MMQQPKRNPLWYALATGGFIISMPYAMAAPTTSADSGVQVGEVSANATAVTQSSYTASSEFSDRVLKDKQKFRASQSVASLGKKELNLFSPQSSGVQALSQLPGINISGYAANSGTARNTISMRGVKVGWNSVPGDLETNGITAMFDGIPLNSLIQGTGWHSPEVPLGALLSGVNVIYGPGNPRDRWYDSLGGTINFIPIQPGRHPYAKASVSYGSDDAIVASAAAATGEIDGWSAVIGTAYAHSNSFRVGLDNWPTRANQVFMKVRKKFTDGRWSVGAYWQRNDEFRPNMIPVTPVAGVTTEGLNIAGAPLYSQQTSGFYSDLPMSVWFKNNLVENYLAYSKLHMKLADNLHLNDLFWYRHGRLRHHRLNINYSGQYTASGAPFAGLEYYIPNSSTFGDKLALDLKLPYNRVSFGGYVINSVTNNQGDLSAVPLSYIMNENFGIGSSTYNNTYVAAFIQDRITPVRHLSIVPGLQWVQYYTQYSNYGPFTAAQYAAQYGAEYPNSPLVQDVNNYSLTNLYNGTSYGFNTSPDVSRTFRRIAPSLGVNYEFLPGFTIFGNVATTYKAPSGGAYNSSVLTDLNELKPIKSNDFAIGFRMLKHHFMGLRKIYADVNFYHDHLSHETEAVTLASNPLVTTFGYGAATLNGINFSLKANVNRALSGFFNLGFNHEYWTTYNYYPNGDTSVVENYAGLPVSNTPVWNATLGLKYRSYLHYGVLSSVLWDQYYGHQYLWDNNTGVPSNQSWGAYNVLNLNETFRTAALHHVVPGVKMVKVSAQIANLLGRKYNSTAYISSGGYFNSANGGYIIANPGAPRTFFLTVAATF